MGNVPTGNGFLIPMWRSGGEKKSTHLLIREKSQKITQKVAQNNFLFLYKILSDFFRFRSYILGESTQKWVKRILAEKSFIQ